MNSSPQAMILSCDHGHKVVLNDFPPQPARTMQNPKTRFAATDSNCTSRTKQKVATEAYQFKLVNSVARAAMKTHVHGAIWGNASKKHENHLCTLIRESRAINPQIAFIWPVPDTLQTTSVSKEPHSSRFDQLEQTFPEYCQLLATNCNFDCRCVPESICLAVLGSPSRFSSTSTVVRNC
jgi:hypothetical protein